MGTLQTRTSGGSRFYVHPKTGRVTPGVTSILNVLDKPAIPRWAAKECATFAVEHRDKLAELADEEAIYAIKSSPWKKRDKAASIGTDAHEWAEAAVWNHQMADDILAMDETQRLVNGYGNAVVSMANVIMDLRPKPILAEQTVWGRGYAGTFDLIADIDGITWLLDWKTGKGVYRETTLQLAAYANAGRYWDKDLVAWMPLPEIERYGVLHVPETGDAPRLVELPVDHADFIAFEHAKHVWRWQNLGGHKGRKSL